MESPDPLVILNQPIVNYKLKPVKDTRRKIIKTSSTIVYVVQEGPWTATPDPIKVKETGQN